MISEKANEQEQSLNYLKRLHAKHQLPFHAESFNLLSDKGQHYVYETVNSDCPDYIIRLPKTTIGNPILKELEHESLVTRVISQQHLNTTTSEVNLFWGERPFAYHQKIEGSLLTKDVYESMPSAEKDIFAAEVAEFLHELHSIPLEKFKNLPPQETPKSLSNKFLKNEFDYPQAKKLLKKYDIDLDQFQTNLCEDKALCHNDLHGENLTIYPPQTRNNGILKGVFDFGNADISNRSSDFIKLVNLDRQFCRKVINNYNGLSSHKVALKEVDYQYLCWQAQNMIIYENARNKYNNDLQSGKVSPEEYNSFQEQYAKFEKLTSAKLTSFRIDIAREKSVQQNTVSKQDCQPASKLKTPLIWQPSKLNKTKGQSL